MRITAKGQVSIPQEVPERAGLMPGTDFDFEIEAGIVRPLTSAACGTNDIIDVLTTDPTWRAWSEVAPSDPAGRCENRFKPGRARLDAGAKIGRSHPSRSRIAMLWPV